MLPPLPQQSHYTFARVSPANLIDLQGIFKAAFGAAPDFESLQHKFNTKAFGLYTVGYIAYDEAGMPAAYYGVFPVKVQIAGKIVLAAQSGDTMTHPLHQGRGLFTKLAKMTYSAAKEEGVELIFGFPNENSFPGFAKKLDWLFPSHLAKLKLISTTIPMSNLAASSYILATIHRKWIRIVLTFYKKADSFSPKENGQNVVMHDRNFLEYKIGKTHQLLKIENSTVWLSISNNIYLGDVNLGPNDDINQIMGKIRNLSRWLMIPVIFYLGSEESMLAKGLIRQGAKCLKMPAGFLPLNPAIVIDENTLIFSGIDSDTF